MLHILYTGNTAELLIFMLMKVCLNKELTAIFSKTRDIYEKVYKVQLLKGGKMKKKDVT